jgi:hypothetical protein
VYIQYHIFDTGYAIFSWTLVVLFVSHWWWLVPNHLCGFICCLCASCTQYLYLVGIRNVDNVLVNAPRSKQHSTFDLERGSSFVTLSEVCITSPSLSPLSSWYLNTSFSYVIAHGFCCNVDMRYSSLSSLIVGILECTESWLVGGLGEWSSLLKRAIGDH